MSGTVNRITQQQDLVRAPEPAPEPWRAEGRPQGAPAAEPHLAARGFNPLESLKRRQAEHPFWSNALFQACQAGHLTRQDFQFIFSQYHHYSRNFTRFLHALMAHCDNDLARARLGENLWEEGGGVDPGKRHAEIFRRFLQHGLGVDPWSVEPLDFTRYFVSAYLDFCLQSSPCRSSAFLSLGTEAIVPRMYGLFVEGLKQAGVEEQHLEFFRIHMACDDAHAATLEELMLSYSAEDGWYTDCQHALDTALELRLGFFDNLYRELQRNRVQGLLERIQARASLMPEGCTAESLHFSAAHSASGEAVYHNTNERLNIDFSVTRASFPAEVLDPRFVRIPPGRFNENHKHAHETVFVVMRGSGQVHVDGRVIEVRTGDLVFAPRWSMHQSRNTGTEELLLLAIADFGLTGKAYVGDYLKTARLKRDAGELKETGMSGGVVVGHGVR